MCIAKFSKLLRELYIKKKTLSDWLISAFLVAYSKRYKGPVGFFQSLSLNFGVCIVHESV